MDEYPPLCDTLWLNNHLSAYKNKRVKAKRLVDQGDLLRLRKGLYLRPDLRDNPEWLCAAAARLYGPSYISFERGLRYYGLIPEDVPLITSATMGKRKRKRYDTAAGTFLYRDVPEAVFPHALQWEKKYLMALPEKALCDKLYTVSGIRSMRTLESLLFEDLRIDEELFKDLNGQRIIELTRLYGTEPLALFQRYWMKRS